MRKYMLLAICVGALALPLAACNDPKDTATVAQSYGPSPNLPPPEHSWIPTVDIASVSRWADGAKPIAANGMTVNALATGLDHPRTVYVLPNGDVLVAESNAPPKPDDGKGIKGFIYKQAQSWAGAGVPSANRITLLRDTDSDGVAETRSTFLSGLNSPFGMVLVGEDFYVANTDAIMKFPYREGDTKISAPGVKLADLPAGTRVEPRRPDLVQKAMAPDYALGAHTASLGLAFNTGNLFPPEMEGGAFIGQHGSWNRKPRSGYKVIFVPFKDGKPSGAPQDVLTGFLNESGEAQGRPVGVRLDKQGALLVADDVGNTIWRVTPSAKSASR